MNRLPLLYKAEDYITELYLNENTAGLYYHDFNHTLNVVEVATAAADELGLSAAERDVLLVAAWFHDVGYLYTRIEHEAKSIEIAQNALHPNYIPLIPSVTACIEATKVGAIPKTPLAALLKDVDVAFGSAYDFVETNSLFREELKDLEGRTFSDTEWERLCLEFLTQVKFYSDYGKQHFAPLVARNLEMYQEGMLLLKKV
jgi:putative nucleotidyltransferase with HDIG domain